MKKEKREAYAARYCLIWAFVERSVKELRCNKQTMLLFYYPKCRKFARTKLGLG
jgi:hypothetical protein